MRAFVCRPHWKMELRRLTHDMFLFVMEGRGEAIIEEKAYALRSGTCLHFGRGLAHEISHRPATPLRVLILHYSALVNFSLSLSEMLGFPESFDLREDTEGLGFLEQCGRLAGHQPPGWQRALEIAALGFLFHLVHQHAARFRPVHPQRLSQLNRLAPVIRLMRENLAHPLSIAEYAAGASLSDTQFRRIFRQTTGLSPNEYLRKLRMERATFLLRNTRETIESISGQVGYTEPAYFAKTFKQLVGMPPGAYRNRSDFMGW